MQSEIEFAIHEAIEEIADEFSLKIPYYPEVYWIAGKFNYNMLSLPEKYRAFFNFIKKGRHSCCLGKRIILIGSNDWEDLTEEAAHFVHYYNAEMPATLKKEEKNSIITFQEMMGFIGSSAVINNRINVYPESPDLFYLSAKEREKYLYNLSKK